jgi:hypothetical protein
VCVGLGFVTCTGNQEDARWNQERNHREISPNDYYQHHMIQVDIGGHPPFPTGSKQYSGIFGNLLFLAGFNFRGHFEGLNEGFSGSTQINEIQRND